MRHIRHALAQGAPDVFPLLTFRINHAGKKDFFKAFGHFLRGPFAKGSALARGLGQLALAAGNIPQKAQKGGSACNERFTLKADFLLGHTFFNHVGRKNLKIRGLKTEVTFAGQQGAAIGSHMIGGGVAFKKLGKPACRGRFHLALGEFPHVHDGDLGGHVFAGFSVRFKHAHCVFPPHVRPVHGAYPGQQARRIEPGFPSVGQQQPQPAPDLFSDQGNLHGIAFHIFHHATRRRVAHTIRHARSFRKSASALP